MSRFMITYWSSLKFEKCWRFLIFYPTFGINSKYVEVWKDVKNHNVIIVLRGKLRVMIWSWFIVLNSHQCAKLPNDLLAFHWLVRVGNLLWRENSYIRCPFSVVVHNICQQILYMPLVYTSKFWWLLLVIEGDHRKFIILI